MKYLFFTLIITSFLITGCSDDSSTTTSNCYTSTSDTTTSTTGNYDIVDTNQTVCYNSSTGAVISCTGTSDTQTAYDADFNGNQPSYTLSGSGNVVTDNVTGLMWTQSTDTDGDADIDSSDKMYQSDAVSYCENLSLDGYDDWRLPDVKTQYSLILFSGSDASFYTGTDTSILEPFISSTFDWAFGDQVAGDRIIDAQYATTTNYVSTTMNGDSTMFGVNFVDGRIKGYPCETKTFYVRCVRGNTDYGLNNFTLTDSGATVTDSATGLMWQQTDSASTDWDDAIDVCKDATTGSHGDWRLPNIKELQSLTDYSRSPDTTNSAAINSIFATTSFTNEEGVTDWYWYWASTTHVEYDTNSTADDGKPGTYIAFGRALGYMDPDILDVHGSGSQRSNNKTNVSGTSGVSSINAGNGLFYYKGPQGDILRQNNRVRCVRDAP